MKTTYACGLVLLTMVFATTYQAMGQTPSSSTRPTQEQSLQELVKEVRQLRAEVRRLGVAAYKSQVLVERLKLQQAEVVRISRDLSAVRETIETSKSEAQKARTRIKLIEKEVEVGARHPKELEELKDGLEASTQNEQRLIDKESQLSGDLVQARTKLAELELQMKNLEHEMTDQ
jgi:outer membrane murein-binding lipoprotein Lpp